ncbi:MAG TPA: hypothetical protein VM933_01515 [Acidimicrobiales bacterium]|nr:hypothetical protein [Acidimicrobiales bacterium]
MRLQQLALRVSGDGQKLRFHERLTVLSGVSTVDRQGVVEVVLGTLAGEATVSSELAYVGPGGQRVTVDQTAEGTFHTFHDDGTPAIPPGVHLGLSVHELFDLMYVDARQLGILQEGTPEPKELLEARAALAALGDQLAAAEVARDAAESFRLELRSIDEEIRQIEAGRPRRRYARMVLELEDLRAERAALAATPAEAEADRAIASHLALLRPVAARWRDAVRRRSDATQAFGAERVRLDAHTLAGALNVPDSVPPHLDRLVDALAAAEAQRATLSARLAGLMASHLESPSHPDVARLARALELHGGAAGADRLWKVAEQAIRTASALEAESIRLGGLVLEGEDETPAIVQELESAHAAVEQAEEVVEKRRMGAVAAGGAAALGAVVLPLSPFLAPLALAGSAAAAYWSVLAPRQQLAEAQGWETDALLRAGVPSYLTFHLRRMEALKDPSLRIPLERAAQAHREAMADWRLLAGDLSPREAVELEDEVRAYAASVSALEGLGDDVTETRRRLTDEVEPLVERARGALMDVCRPFGIEHPTLAADLVRQLAEVAKVARLQETLERAEAEEREARTVLEDLLCRLGHAGGDLQARVAAFEERASGAEARVLARTKARSVHDISREIERLEALARTEHRTEYGRTFTAADAREPDPDQLQMRRELTATAYHTANRLVPDVEHIADRTAALERRVGMLEREHGEVGSPTPSRMAELERRLQERLAGLRHCGVDGESLPLLLDECFLHLRPDAKWAMLDLVDRFSAHAQVVYLTDDADVATWARRRATTGSITFLDPLRQQLAHR